MGTEGGEAGELAPKHKNLTLPMEMGKQIFTTTPSKMHQNAPFSYLKYKIFQRGGVSPSPHPTPLGASILAPSVLDGTPRKNPGYGPGREGKGEVGQGTGDEGGEGRAPSSFGIGPPDAESAKNLRIKVSKVSK
jgi:hypothetical protein